MDTIKNWMPSNSAVDFGIYPLARSQKHQGFIMSWWLRILSGTVHWENIVKGQMVKTSESACLQLTKDFLKKKARDITIITPPKKRRLKQIRKCPFPILVWCSGSVGDFSMTQRKKNSFTKLPHHFLTTLPPTLGSYKFEAVRDTIFRASGSTCTDPWVVFFCENASQFRGNWPFYPPNVGGHQQPLKGLEILIGNFGSRWFKPWPNFIPYTLEVT